MLKIDEAKVFSEIESRNPKSVVLNSASGIIRLTHALAQKINEKYSIPAIIIGEPSYGVCDTVDQDATRLGADIAFHIGHTVSIGRMGTRTILIDAFDDVSFDQVLGIAIQSLKSYRSVGLCTDSQYLNALPIAKSFFEKAGFRAVVGRGRGLLTEGQVFGCEFYPAFDIREEVDAFVFLGQSRFHSLGITEHDDILYEMGIKEKEHEVHFMEVIQNAKWLPLFEKVFAWGANTSLNDVDLENTYPVEKSDQYCKNYKSGRGSHDAGGGTK